MSEEARERREIERRRAISRAKAREAKMVAAMVAGLNRKVKERDPCFEAWKERRYVEGC